MNTPTNRSDGKLLFAIAAGILIIAAGIAVLTSLGQDDEREAPKLAAVPALNTGAVEPTVLPASIESDPIPQPTSLAELVENVEPFVIDPTADLVGQGITAYEARDFARAAAYLGAEVEARTDNAWTHYLRALSLWKSGQADAAATAMRRSLELDAGQVKSLVNLARIENDRGEFDAALAATDEALKLDPEHAQAWFLRARSLYNVGDKEAALAAIEESVSRDAENGYAHNLAGLIWIERGESAVALAAMERAATRIPDVSFVQNNLGMALELEGRPDEAAAAYARALQLLPDHERSAMNLARLDGRIPETPEHTPEPEPVVAVLSESESSPEHKPVIDPASDESEIPD